MVIALHAVRSARVEKVRGILDADDDDDDDDAEDDNEDAMVSNVGGSSDEAAATTESHACAHASRLSTPRKCASITKSAVAMAPASGTIR